ncbi:MAG: HepT-like ribonuclease domain-containing protein [Candidatus Firestonebacteria bacterium]
MKEEIKERLVKYINFLEEEIKDYPFFKSLTWEIYRTERSRRRDVERWIENLVNSLIDISKIVLTVEEISIPETYREMVFSLSLVSEFNKEEVEKLSQLVKLRNIITHEYLDIRWASIKKFIEETFSLYSALLERIKEYLKSRLKTDLGKI